MVRVLVDSQDAAGITLDDVAAVSRRISDLLDAAELDEPDLLGGAYVLEVSSPGVDRPLTLPRHWKRSVTRLVTTALADGTSVTGRVASADDLEVVLDVDGTERTLLLAEVLSGAVQVEFSRPGVPDLDEADIADDIEDDEEDDA